MLDLTALKKTKTTQSPFPYLVVPRFIKQDACPLIHADYPKINLNGSFPLQELKYGPHFQKLIEHLKGEEFRGLIEEKFKVSLAGLPTLTTVRGKCSLKDGQIHKDSVTKIITVLIYMNGVWEKGGGQLRLLNSSEDIEDYCMEIPPIEGTLLVFQVTPNSWHGHLPFEGERRVIQFNWLTNAKVAKKEIFRHRLSAKIKKLRFFLGM
jgi:SM-20-related protein